MIKKSYNSDGLLTEKKNYSYDKKGNELEKISWFNFSQDVEKIQFTYDVNNNKIEELEYLADGSLKSRITNKYDDKGRIIESIPFYSNGSIGAHRKCKYDSKGNLIESFLTYEDGRQDANDIYTSEYIYDTTNNWIKKVYFNSFNPVYIIEREIKYF